MKAPYIRIQQKDEIFFITKFSSDVLKKKVNFHFRQSYTTKNNEFEDYLKYMDKVRRMGLEINAEEEGIQRRVQIKRIEAIKDYLENQTESFFPNTVILSVDLSNDDDFMKNYTQYEENEIGFFDFPEDVEFQIVDGQHRLAGLFISSDELQKSFEMPVVLLINITINTCAKIFADVNGNQAPVNRSVIYDLYELMDEDDNKNIERNKKLHSICKMLNNDNKSPLYQHIKMLGIGNGAISQAFFVNALRKAFDTINYNYENLQEMYECLFFYFYAFQDIFPTEWPVLRIYKDYEEFLNYSKNVLKEKKSQLLKTNGFGAIMYLFPEVYKSINSHDYKSYYDQIIKLKSIDWCNDEILKGGTGEKTQKAMANKLRDLLNK